MISNKPLYIKSVGAQYAIFTDTPTTRVCSYMYTLAADCDELVTVTSHGLRTPGFLPPTFKHFLFYMLVLLTCVKDI